MFKKLGSTEREPLSQKKITENDLINETITVGDFKYNLRSFLSWKVNTYLKSVYLKELQNNN